MANPKRKKINWNIEFGGVSRKDILLFTRHLAIALKNGLTLKDGLGLLYDEASRQKWKSILGNLLETIEAGKPFHEALSHYPRYFSSIYVNLVKTGELSGTLEQNLNHLAESIRKQQEFQQKIKSSLMYPTMIFVAVIGLGMSVAIFVLPKILPLFKSLDIELPLTTRILIIVADFLAKHGLLVALGSFFFIIFLVWFVRRDFVKPLTHPLLLKIPGIGGLIKNIELQRFTRILGTLLKSGVTLNESLRITTDATTNRVYRKAIYSCIGEVEKGNPLAQALAQYPNTFPKIATGMVGMAEATGGLESTLIYLSEMYEEEVNNTMKNVSTIVEPILLIFIGVAVGTVAISILGPIYKVTGGVKV